MNQESCFWRHDWTKWEDKTDGVKTYDDNGTKRVIGKIIVQERRCQRCNEARLRIEEVTISGT